MDQARYDHLMGIYRSIRRGANLLTKLEDNLREDLNLLEVIVDKGAMTNVEKEFVIQSIETIREVSEDTLNAVSDLKREVNASEALDDEAFKGIIAQAGLHETTRSTALNAINLNGGVRSILDNAIGQLRMRVQLYAEAVEVANAGDPNSVGRALDMVRPAFEQADLPFPVRVEGPFKTWEQLINEWKELLSEQESKSYQEAVDEGSIPYVELVGRLCQENPRLAMELDLVCPDERPGSLVLCAIRPLICLIVIIIILASEGEAH